MVCRKWFKQDGALHLLPHSKSHISTRPNIKIDKNELYAYAKAGAITNVCEEIIIHQPRILEFSVNTVHFKHHPLFSTEHVLQQKLLDAIEMYHSKFSQGNITKIVNQLEVARNKKKKCELLLKKSGDASVLDNKKIDDYSKEIIALRNRWFNDGKAERAMMKIILKIWKTIKQIREANNFSNTSIRLAIRKVPCNYESEKLDLDQRIEEICKEIIDEHNMQFSVAMKKYKEELQEWKTSKNNSTLDQDEVMAKKPKKPTKKLNDEQVKNDVTKMMNESFKAPGEPQIYFEIHFDHKVTENVENVKEKQRRLAVNSSTIYLKLLCDGIEISKTKTVSLNNSFKCRFDECLSLQLVNVPVNLNIEIYEQPSTLQKRTYSHIKLPVPPQKVSFKSSAVSEMYFTKDEIVHYKHAAVGSGILITEILGSPAIYNDNDTLKTEGIICYNLGWDKALNKLTGFQEKKSMEIKNLDSIFTKDGLVDATSLAKWTEENQIDPENPRNTVLYEYIKMFSDNSFVSDSNKEYFR